MARRNHQAHSFRVQHMANTGSVRLGCSLPESCGLFWPLRHANRDGKDPTLPAVCPFLEIPIWPHSRRAPASADGRHARRVRSRARETGTRNTFGAMKEVVPCQLRLPGDGQAWGVDPALDRRALPASLPKRRDRRANDLRYDSMPTHGVGIESRAANSNRNSAGSG